MTLIRAKIYQLTMEEVELLSILAAVLFMFCAWYFIWGLNSSGKKNCPPSPPRLPIIGNLHQLGELPHRSLWDLSKKHGPLMLLQFGSKPTVVVSSADAAREILKTHDLSFASRPVLNDFKKVFYDANDLITLEYGEQWRKLRSIFVHELLGNTRLTSFSSIMEEEIALMVEKIEQCCTASSSVNLTYMFITLANDLICRTASGKKHSETEYGKDVVEAIDEGVGLLVNFRLGEFIPRLGWIDWLKGFNASLDRCVEKRDKLMDCFLADYMNKASETSKRENFLDVLLEMYKGDNPSFSIDLITLKGVLMDLFGAGTETSATTLGWLMTELIRHPEVMKRLQEEIREIMKGKHHICVDDLRKMHYLKAVMKETFRYHPSIATYFRIAKEHVNIMGYDILPGTWVLINAWAIGRDPAYWHKPEKFMPERFLDSDVNYKGFDFQLLPFGAGRRICPGIGFATTSIELTIANLMHKFDWALPDGVKGEDLDVTERPGFAIGRKNPLIVVPTKCYI